MQQVEGNAAAVTRQHFDERHDGQSSYYREGRQEDDEPRLDRLSDSPIAGGLSEGRLSCLWWLALSLIIACHRGVGGREETLPPT